MNKKVYIVGLGPGAREYILPVAVKTAEDSNLIIGFKRAVESLNFINNKKVIVERISEIIDIINKENNVCIVASGDPCFYGITNYIKKNFNGDVEVIPGISSYQYLMSKLCIPWQNAALGSMHGREQDFENIVRSKELSIWLTDKNNSPQSLCKKLSDSQIEAVVHIGEHLSYENEKITTGKPHKLQKEEFSPLSIVVIERVI